MTATGTARTPALLASAIAGACLLLSACGGGGGTTATTGGGGTGGTGGGGTSNVCSLASRQAWALGQINEWYLFPSLLDTGVNPSSFGSLQSYIDALVAPARAQSRDRGFTYVTSIAEENAFNNSGQTAAFGIRVQYNNTARTAFIADAFEGAPALAAGIDRGMELVGVGPDAGNLTAVATLMASGGSAAVSDALGPGTVGLTRALQLRRTDGTTFTVTITKANFSIQPVSPRFGARIIDNGGTPVGYLNMRTFINTADPQLRAAFLDFRTRGITHFIIDFRYNGGGLVSIAELMGNLLGRDRTADQVFAQTVFRPEKAVNNTTARFAPQPQSVAPVRIAFIGTGATASASEFVMNGMIPYLRNNVALVGANTFGKPVGQVGLDLAACDDRLRVTAFATQNADRQGDYYTGMASVMPNTCVAGDDLTRQMGDPAETSTARALDFLAGRSCTSITASAREASGGTRVMAEARDPSVAQREVPGLF